MNAPKANTPSHLKDLLLLFSVPIAIAVIAAVTLYIPRALAKPTYDFIYAVCPDYRCENSFSVNSTGDIVENVPGSSNADYYKRTATLHYYDAAADATRSITIAEARQYMLHTSSKSPDGYTLAKEDENSGFLFWGHNDDGWYIKNGAKKKKVTLTIHNTYYSHEITFLGWVVKNEK